MTNGWRTNRGSRDFLYGTPPEPSPFDDPMGGMPVRAMPVGAANVDPSVMDRLKSAGRGAWGLAQKIPGAIGGMRDRAFEHYGSQDPYSEFLSPEQRRSAGRAMLQDYGARLVAASGPTALPTGASAFGSAWLGTQQSANERIKKQFAAEQYRRELARRARIGGIDPSTPEGRSAASREAMVAGEYGDAAKWMEPRKTPWKMRSRVEGRETVYEEVNEETGDVREISRGPRSLRAEETIENERWAEETVARIRRGEITIDDLSEGEEQALRFHLQKFRQPGYFEGRYEGHDPLRPSRPAPGGRTGFGGFGDIDTGVRK